MYFSERNSLPNIDWNKKDHVSSLTAHKLTWTAQQILEPEDNDETSDSELQSSDSEDLDELENDAQSDSSEMGDFIKHSCPRH